MGAVLLHWLAFSESGIGEDMATEVNILFTGICLFLTDTNRVVIGVAEERENCSRTATIPKHRPYLTYGREHRVSGKAAWKSNGPQEAVLLSGLIEFHGNVVETQVTYPGSTPRLPNVVVTNQIAPTYTPLPTVRENNPANIDPAIVAARIDLPPGTFATPIATRETWQFRPPKPPTSSPVRMKIAQAVKLTLHVTDDSLSITESPFGTRGTSEVVTLKASGKRMTIIIGNSSEPDITPKVPRTQPGSGPDYDFELHWNLFDRKNDPECPPISYNEGASGDVVPRTLGGGNCPPTQWP
jgi:hypothetical protein